MTNLIRSGPVPGTDVAAPQPTGLAMLDTRALEAQLALLEDPKRLELMQRLAGAYDRACAALIGEGDVQREGKGANARVFKKKSAWRKLGRHFGISTRILNETIEQLEGGEFIAKCVVRGSAPWGQEIDATGACGSDEESGRRSITMADAIATAQTRAANRAVSDLVAMGEVSAEEIGDRTAAAGDERPARVSNEPELVLETALELPFPWKQHKKYGDKQLKDVSTKFLLVLGEWAKAKIDEAVAGGETPSKSVAQLLRATILITESRPDLEQAIEERQREKDADDKRAAGATAANVDQDGAPRSQDPADAAPASTNGEPPLDPTQAAENDPAARRIADADPTTPTPSPSSSTAAAGSIERHDAGPLVSQESAAPEATLKELSVRLVQLLEDRRTPHDVRERILNSAGSGGMTELSQYKRAIAELSLIHATAE